MKIFTISGSITDPSEAVAPLGSYKATVYGTYSIDGTGRNALAALYNSSTGSVDLRLNSVRVSVSPIGNTVANDVAFVLGALASGSVSGSATSAVPLDPTYPTSVAVGYGTTITGPTLLDPTDGFLVQSQSQRLSYSPSPPILIVAENDHMLTEDPLVVVPGRSYVVSLTQANSGPSGATVYAYLAEFGWDEVA